MPDIEVDSLCWQPCSALQHGLPPHSASCFAAALIHPTMPCLQCACLQKAQTLVQEVLTHSATAKSFEASSYYAQARAQIAVEKVHAVAGHLSDMQKVGDGTH